MTALPKVLLVDDRPENLLALEAQLRNQPAELLKAGSGREALDLLLVHEVAVAIVDVQMPELDGFELAELMRGSVRTRDIPIILVTAGLHDQSRIFKGYEAGAVDFLIKPVETRLLCNKVGVFLQLHEKNRQLAERVQELESAQQALRVERDQKAWLASLPEQNPSPVLRLTEDGSIHYLNASARTAFPDWKLDLGGKAPSELMDRVRRAFETRQIQEVELFQGGRWYALTVEAWDQEANIYALDITASKESERRFRALAENITQLAWTARPDGHIAWYNRRWYEYTGTTLQQMEGWGWKSVHDPAVLPDVLERWTIALAKGAPFEMEFPLRGADGRFRRFLTRASPLKDDSGKVVEWFGTCTDVTPLVEAKEALHASEERLRTVVQNSRDGITMQDLQTGGYLFISPAQAELTGFTEAELRALPFQESYGRVHPDDRDILIYQQQEIAAGRDPPGPVEYRWKVKSGEYRWFSDSRRLVHDELGRPVSVVGVSRDVTDRKRAEQAQHASEARLNLLSRTASSLLRAEEPQKVVEDLCMEVMQHLDCQVFFNFLADKTMGNLVLNAYAGISQQQASEIMRLEYGVAVCGCVAVQGSRIVVDQIASSCDERVTLVKSYGVQAYCCHPLMGQGGAVLGTLSFGTTTRAHFGDDEIELMRVVADQVATAIQRVQARDALSATNAQLVDADRRKNEFMAMLSHELRNPLAPIKNCLHILDHASPGSEQARRAKATIDRQVNQLSRLVDDLLDITRITRGKIELQRERLELGDLVRRTIEDHRSEFDKKDVVLVHEPCSELLWVNADSNRLGQSVGNLLQNAAKFTPTGGRVTVSVATDSAAKQAVIQVVDTGVGIDAHMLTRLFQPFMQAETGLDRRGGGLGLGLALVKGMAELHGGTVEAKSDGLGKGATITLRLPLDVPSVAAQPAAGERTAVPRQRVLIIEDNVDAAESLREVLEFGNHDIAVAYNGSDGLEKARHHRPTVIFCDIGLPGMDGYEVARLVRAEPELKDVHLVALSGYALPEDLQRAHDAGFDRHMPKPPSLHQLEELLAALPTPRAQPHPDNPTRWLEH
jgi:PAS domain S-box-containing protein